MTTSGSYVRSVNAGPAVDVPWGKLRRSGIDKRPVQDAVAVTALGLAGDEIADQVHHGGLDQAVYAYAREDLDWWEAETGRPLPDGCFGENLTTVGVDVQGARLGERWQVGTTVLEVCDVRIPCSVFAGFLGERQWVKRFAARGVPGVYLRVLHEGHVRAGDAVEVLERPAHDLTAGLVFRAQTTERELLPLLAAEPRASAKIRRAVSAVSIR